MWVPTCFSWPTWVLMSSMSRKFIFVISISVSMPVISFRWLATVFAPSLAIWLNRFSFRMSMCKFRSSPRLISRHLSQCLHVQYRHDVSLAEDRSTRQSGDAGQDALERFDDDLFLAAHRVAVDGDLPLGLLDPNEHPVAVLGLAGHVQRVAETHEGVDRIVVRDDLLALDGLDLLHPANLVHVLDGDAVLLVA